MRLLAVIFLAGVMYVAVPYLWERAMVAQVSKLEKAGPPIPVTNYVSPIDSATMANVITPPVEINTEEYERIAIESQANDAVRQAQQAQDMAWQAQHPPGMH